MIEIPPELAQTALVVVDNRDAAQAEAGELLAAEQNGAFRIHDTAEIGEVLARTRVGRTSVDQITFFKSVGVAVQDALAAQLALTNADMLALGQRVSW
jgi:ornithine cyclodeaminase